jgi:hypothetical protein
MFTTPKLAHTLVVAPTKPFFFHGPEPAGLAGLQKLLLISRYRLLSDLKLLSNMK